VRNDSAAFWKSVPIDIKAKWIEEMERKYTKNKLSYLTG